MLSSISGVYFAGHRQPQSKLVNLNDADLWYDMSFGSYPGSGTSIFNIVDSINTATTTNTSLVYSSTNPKSLQFTGGNQASVTLSTGMLLPKPTRYLAINFWYKPTSFPAVSSLILSYLDDITGYGYTLTALPGGAVRVSSITQYGTVTSLTSTALVLNTWQMLTFILAGNAGNNSYLYINSFPASSGAVLQGSATQTRMKLIFPMAGGIWNDLQVTGNTSKIINSQMYWSSTRAYYGV